MNGLQRSFVFGRFLALLALALIGGGCAQRDEIASYEVLKPEIVDPTLTAKPAALADAKPQKTIGLILPAGDMSWFFKLTGSVEAIEPLENSFLEFVKSVKLAKSEGATPDWTLPEGWQQLPGSQFRFATLRMPAATSSDETSSDKPLDITVSQAGGDMLANVNRWRGQLNLPPISAADLETAAKKLTIDGREATYVSLVGTGSGGMGGGPFAPFTGGALPPDHPPIGDAKK